MSIVERDRSNAIAYVVKLADEADAEAKRLAYVNSDSRSSFSRSEVEELRACGRSSAFMEIAAYLATAPTFNTEAPVVDNDEIATIAARIDDATPLPYDGATAEDTARAWRHNGGIAGRTLRLVRDGIPHRLLTALQDTRGALEAALAELHPEALARLGRCKHCRAKLDATWQGEHRDGCAWLWLGGGDVSLLHPQQAKPLGEDVPQ